MHKVLPKEVDPSRVGHAICIGRSPHAVVREDVERRKKALHCLMSCGARFGEGVNILNVWPTIRDYVQGVLQGNMIRIVNRSGYHRKRLHLPIHTARLDLDLFLRRHR